MLQNVPTNFLKGIDRTDAPLVADKRSLYVMRNLRHAFGQRGVLQQTPYFYDYGTFAQGTYYDAGSQTEPATSSIRMVTADLIVTDYVMRGSGGSQVQVFFQTTVPATETIYTGCRLVINSITGAAVTLGQTVDIRILAGGATFEWRKNGGAYAGALACSTAGTSFDGGNFTAYFLASSGFTVGDVFSWTRLDRSWASTGTFEYPCEFSYYKGELYFNSVDDRMMVMSNSSTGKYVISVGYRPVVGSYFTFFDDHLVVTWFRKGTTGWSGADRWYIIGWSDKTDVHNFIPTDKNEADQYALPNNNKFDTVGNSAPASYIMGITVEQAQMFVFTNNELYYTSALGLPIVFSFQKLMNLALPSAYSPIIKADRGTYVIGYDDIYFFDGANLKSIAAPIINGVDSNNFENTFGCWDPFKKELVISQKTLLFVYQEKWDSWYTRLANFDSQTQPVKCVTAYIGNLIVGIRSLKLRREDDAGTSQPIKDDASGTSFAEPYLVTQIFGDDLSVVKELSEVYFSGIVNNSGVSSTYYTTGSGIVVQFSYWLTPNGDFTLVSETVPTNATWTSASLTGLISDMRVPFRGIAIALEIQGTVSKPPAFVQIQQLTPLIYNAALKKVEK